jgi:hypothetical protein
VTQFQYRSVTANQYLEGLMGDNPRKVWRVATVDGKKDPATGQELSEYINRLSQESWELFSDTVNGTSREMVFKHSTVLGRVSLI